MEIMGFKIPDDIIEKAKSIKDPSELVTLLKGAGVDLPLDKAPELLSKLSGGKAPDVSSLAGDAAKMLGLGK